MEPAKTRTGMGDSGTTTQVRWCLQHLSCNAMLNNTATAVATELYPSGGEGFVRKMGNISMTYIHNGDSGEVVLENNGGDVVDAVAWERAIYSKVNVTTFNNATDIHDSANETFLIRHNGVNSKGSYGNGGGNGGDGGDG